jgi:hypothetical protein
MSDDSFYLTIAELSGTLLGLAFVAITHHFSSLGTDLFSDPRENLKAKALWTCVFDSAVLSLSLLLLPFCASLLMLTITPESDAVKIGLGVLGVIWAGVMLVVFREKLYARKMGRTHEYEVVLPLRFEDYIQFILGVLTTALLSTVLLVIGLLPAAFLHRSFHVSVDQMDAYIELVCAAYLIAGLMALYNDLFSPYPLTTYPAEWALLKPPDGPTEPVLQRIKRLLRLLPHREIGPGSPIPADTLAENQPPWEATHLRTQLPAEALAARMGELENLFRDLGQAWQARRDIRALVEAAGKLDRVELRELELWTAEMRQCKDCLTEAVVILESMIAACAVNQEESEEQAPIDP